RFLIQFLCRIHEARNLQMNAHGSRPERLHFVEIGCDRIPFLFPVSLEQSVRAVVVVIKTPGRELQPGIREDESFSVFADADEAGRWISRLRLFGRFWLRNATQ